MNSNATTRRTWRWWRQQAHDLWLLFIAPGIGALLPWPLGFRWLRWLSRYSTLFDEAVLPATRAALSAMPGIDAKRFSEHARLVWLFDHYDLHLDRFRGKYRAGLPKQIGVRGEWPRTGGFIATGFHHGTGYWIFRTLRDAQHASIAIFAERGEDDHARLPVRYLYGSLRLHGVETLAGGKGVFRPNIRRALEAVKKGSTATALADVPPRLAGRGQVPVRLLDRKASLPVGVVKIAQTCSVPLVPFWTEFDFAAGERTLVIGEAIDSTDALAAVQRLAAILDGLIRQTPEAWLFWPEFPQWIEDAKPLWNAPPPDSG